VQQLPAYDLCIQHIRNYNKKNLSNTTTQKQIQWAVMYDLDEFLVMKKHKTISALVKDHCPVRKGCGGLLINWYIFFSGNETAYAPIPMTKRFPYREPRLDKRVKSIVHVDSYDTPAGNPHCFKYLNNRISYDTRGIALCPYNRKGRTDSVAALYHLRTKSRGEFLYKCVRGDADVNESRCEEFQDDPPNLIYDDSAWQVLKENVPSYKWYDQEGAGIYGW
jgi:hypothetical protein